MLTRARLLSSAMMAAVTSIGYPDWFRPRDYLAGLEGSQVWATWTLTAPSGTHDFYTIPAGKTLVVRLIGNNVAGHTAPAAPGNGLLRAYLEISKGLSGAGSAIQLAWTEVILAPGGYDHDSQVIPGPIVIPGGASGNVLRAGNTLTNIDSFDGLLYVLGALLD
jgi:hypothetical protein